MKIQIIGYSGSGKSTLAKSLRDIYNLNVLHLDSVHFKENWVEVTKEEMTNSVKEFMEINCDGWIIEGNYTSIVPERFRVADILIFLNFNRFFCFKSARKRYKKNKGTFRDDVGKGCVEKFDFEFGKWILLTGRDRKHKKKYKEILSQCKKVLVFKNRKQVNRYIRELGNAQKNNRTGCEVCLKD